jgi:hypothetical protein
MIGHRCLKLLPLASVSEFIKQRACQRIHIERDKLIVEGFMSWLPAHRLVRTILFQAPWAEKLPIFQRPPAGTHLADQYPS